MSAFCSQEILGPPKREKQKSKERKSVSQKAKAIVAAGIVQKEKKKKRKKHPGVEKEMDQSSEIPLGISKKKPETLRAGR